MSLILAQFVLELLLTMCKAYQDFYNQIVYKNRIIGLICSINLLKPSLFIKFNTFINIYTTFYFNSSHPTQMHLSYCLSGFYVYVVVLFNSENVHLDQQFNSEKCNTTITQFHQQFSFTKQFTTYLTIPTRKLVSHLFNQAFYYKATISNY